MEGVFLAQFYDRSDLERGTYGLHQVYKSQYFLMYILFSEMAHADIQYDIYTTVINEAPEEHSEANYSDFFYSNLQMSIEQQTIGENGY